MLTVLPFHSPTQPYFFRMVLRQFLKERYCSLMRPRLSNYVFVCNLILRTYRGVLTVMIEHIANDLKKNVSSIVLVNNYP